MELIGEHGYAATMKRKVMPALARCRADGWFRPAQSPSLGRPPTPGPLHYVCYDAGKFDEVQEGGATAQFHGAVLISHGFTEYAAKYLEIAWYFLLSGYSVCILEHRGHGFSPRDVTDPSLVWIDDWRRYVADLAAFCADVVQGYADGRPVCLFAHSMGGAIGAALLERYPTSIDKAVLSAPMLAPRTGMPMWLAPLVIGAACRAGLGTHMVPGHRPFSEHIDPSEYAGESEARALWFHRQRVGHREYQTYGASFAWVREALRMSHAVLRSPACEQVETPLLVFQAESDRYVLAKAQNRFVTQVQAGGCTAKLIRVPHSRHELFAMPNAILKSYLTAIFDFFGSPTALGDNY